MAVFIETYYEFDKSEFNKIYTTLKNHILALNKKQIYLSSSVQYLKFLKELYNEMYIDKELININLKLIPVCDHSCHEGQILGCSRFKINKNIKNTAVFINLTDGVFHSKILKINNPDLMIFNLDPKINAITEITDNDIKQIKNKEKTGLVKFYDSRFIGVVVCLKQGQLINSKKLKELESFLKRHGKEYKLFLCDVVDFREFENFNFIDYWINTACPRLSYDDAIEHNVLFPYYKDLIENIE